MVLFQSWLTGEQVHKIKKVPLPQVFHLLYHPRQQGEDMVGNINEKLYQYTKYPTYFAPYHTDKDKTWFSFKVDSKVNKFSNLNYQ